MAKDKPKTDKDKQRLITPTFRVSYPHVFKASGMKGAEPKFSITMLFPKNADLSGLKRAMKQAKIAQFGPDESDWPDDLESPVVDGDSKKHRDKEGYKGHWAIKASSNADSKPGLVDENAEPIVDAADFYPGCYARAYIFARVWEFGGKQGIHFILDHVQKMKDGKSFGGKKPIDQVFSPVNDDGADSDADEDEDSEDFT